MTHRRTPPSMSRQRGVVLLFSLIALVVLLIAAVALMRSFNASLFTSGNIAFKRDLQNQGERAIDIVMAKFRSGGVLSTVASRAASLQSSNYSAQMLTTNAQGIPDALQSDSNFLTVGVTTNDITPSNESSLANQAVSIRYVVDRMCNAVGNEKTLGSTSCLLVDSQQQPGASFTEWQSAAGASLNGNASAAPQGVVYRLTVRVQGPRNTQSFFQSTFTAPSS